MKKVRLTTRKLSTLFPILGLFTILVVSLNPVQASVNEQETRGTTPPVLSNEMPEDGSTFVDVGTNISFLISDTESGVNNASIVMRVNTNTVTPMLTSDPSGTTVTYNPSNDLPFDSEIVVSVDACDNNGNCFNNETFTFRTAGQDTNFTAVSDDFNYCNLNQSPANWTFVDPENDSSHTLGDEFDALEIHVPAGNAHDPIGINESARLLQSVGNDPNFIIETKFLSVPVDKFQIQGMMVEEDINDFIRFDLSHNGIALRAFVATYVDGVQEVKALVNVPDATRYLLINRIGIDWELHRSVDGTSWKPVVQFAHDMEVNNVGIYGGNAPSGGNTPEFTAVFDYFLDWGQPFSGGEDAEQLTLPVTVIGGGSVDKSNECGSPLTLTAVPDPGWVFEGWTGLVQRTNNPLTINDWDNGDSITATFVRDGFFLFLPAIFEN